MTSSDFGRITGFPPEEDTFKIVDIDLYRHINGQFRYLHVQYVVPSNDGRWFASSMELGFN